MSVHTPSDSRKVTTKRFQEMKDRGEKITMLTSYDYTLASIVDQAGVDSILVGDSASNVVMGNDTTLPITLDQMIFLGKCVARAPKRALVAVDMPFGTYQGTPQKALESAVRIMKETHADCIKLEGGAEIIDSVRMILAAGIPIIGHLGLTPQSINKFGGYSIRAKEEAEAMKVEYEQNMQDAKTKAGDIISTAQKAAAKQSEDMIREASEQVVQMKTKAENDIALEKRTAAATGRPTTKRPRPTSAR